MNRFNIYLFLLDHFPMIQKFVFLTLCMLLINVASVIVETGTSGVMNESISYLRKWLSPALALFFVVFYIVEDPPEVLVKIAITATVIAIVIFFTSVVDDILLFFGDNLASQLVITISRLVVIIIAAFVCASSVWNIDLAEISTAMGLVTLGISLSFQTILTDLFAGVTTALSRTITLYESVEIRLDDGTEVAGTVTEIGWRYLYIATEESGVFTIPHSRLNSAIIVRNEDS